jgi:hypothetical protein
MVENAGRNAKPQFFDVIEAIAISQANGYLFVMADSVSHREAEIWIREHGLPEKIGGRFSKKRLELRSGGKFEFDAVSDDNNLVISIATNGGITSGGKKATPKLHKIRSDALFLLLVEVERRMIVLSDRLMFDLVQKEVDAGRFPVEVETLLIELPIEIEQALIFARKTAAEEVTRVPV